MTFEFSVAIPDFKMCVETFVVYFFMVQRIKQCYEPVVPKQPDKRERGMIQLAVRHVKNLDDARGKKPLGLDFDKVGNRDFLRDKKSGNDVEMAVYVDYIVDFPAYDEQ